MSKTPDYMYRVPEALSEVMDDIGVNDRLVKKRKRAWMLIENSRKIMPCEYATWYHFGSQSEGSTTLGLMSDIDILISVNNVNIIQNMSEWKPKMKLNQMMIQNENTSPGYCYLQDIRPDQPLPATVNDIGNMAMDCVMDSEGRLILRNTHLTQVYGQIKSYTQTHGPAATIPGKPGIDMVMGFCSKSSPYQVISWVKKQRGCKWPTEEVLEKCRNVGCFVVAVGSKVSYEPELEWRISTSLQERYLMFSLNITQLKCYILMKMILKTHIDPHVQDVLSSFLCKNVLWYCIANSSHDWHTGKLLSYLHLCLFMLKECVGQRNCPHFIIPENNLLAGRMTDTDRGKLLDIINNLMKNGEQFLYEIQMDKLGRRLMMKLNMISYSPNIPSATLISQMISHALVVETVKALSNCFDNILNKITYESLERALQHLLSTFIKLERDKREGNLSGQTLRKYLISLVGSTLGSVIASTDIDTEKEIEKEAFTFLEAGKESDALSGRLKLVSVLYCTGDMERAESELSIIERQYNVSELQTVCGCFTMTYKLPNYKLGCINAFCVNNETAIKSHVALCTRFLQCEIKCVPHDLRYEILRSYIEKDRQIRTDSESWWMDFIVVDSIPYRYFLQYKTYGHLQRRTEQEEALFNLAQSIKFEPDLGHKETALNLLGQCLEQENRQTKAFQCYIWSLRCRKRNNAARFLLCIQLFKLWKQFNAQGTHSGFRAASGKK